MLHIDWGVWGTWYPGSRSIKWVKTCNSLVLRYCSLMPSSVENWVTAAKYPSDRDLNSFSEKKCWLLLGVLQRKESLPSSVAQGWVQWSGLHLQLSTAAYFYFEVFGRDTQSISSKGKLQCVVDKLGLFPRASSVCLPGPMTSYLKPGWRTFQLLESMITEEFYKEGGEESCIYSEHMKTLLSICRHKFLVLCVCAVTFH